MLIFRKILRAYWMDDPIPQSFAILTWAYFYWGWFQTMFITTATLIFAYYVVNKPRKGNRYFETGQEKVTDILKQAKKR